MKWSPFLIVLIAMALILQILLLYLAHVPEERPLKGDERRYHMNALQVSSGINPEQDFIWPPLYHYILGGLYSIFGVKRLSVELFQILLLFLSGYIFYRLILVSGLGTSAAEAGLFLYLLDPQIVSFAQFLWPEILHLFLLFLMLGFLFLTSSRNSLSFFAAGISMGAAILTKSLMTPFVPVLVIAAAYQSPHRTLFSRLKSASAFTLGLCVLVFPLVAWNGVRHGFWGIADSASFNLWLGLKGDLYAAQEFNQYQRLSDSPFERSRILRERISRKVGQEGFWNILSAQVKRQYFRLMNKDSFLTEQFPGGRWGSHNGTIGWVLSVLTSWSYIVYGATLVLAMLGLFQIRWERDFKRVALPGLFLLYNFALFLFFYAKTRYRIQMLPALIFFASLGVSYFLQNRKESRALPAPGMRFLTGILASGILVYLAFAPESV